MEIGKYQEAVSYADQALAVNNSDYKTYYVRGLANYLAEDYNAAVADFSNAINQNANVAQLYNERASANRMNGNY